MAGPRYRPPSAGIPRVSRSCSRSGSIPRFRWRAPARRERTLGAYWRMDSIRRSKKKRQAQAQADAPTFRGIAEEYVAKLRREKRSEATMAKIEWLLGFANAEFGDEPLGQIAAPAILRVLRSLESRERYESARRLRSNIGSVFRYAIATARAEFDPTYALRGRFDASQGDAAFGDHRRQEIRRLASRHRRIRRAAWHTDRVAIVSRRLCSTDRRHSHKTHKPSSPTCDRYPIRNGVAPVILHGRSAHVVQVGPAR